jgi:hypothetical protein
MIKINIPYVITITISILLLFIGHKYATDGMINFQNVPHETVKARVQRIVDRVLPNYTFFEPQHDLSIMDEDSALDDFDDC